MDPVDVTADEKMQARLRDLYDARDKGKGEKAA